MGCAASHNTGDIYRYEFFPSPPGMYAGEGRGEGNESRLFPLL